MTLSWTTTDTEHFNGIVSHTKLEKEARDAICP
jgi:hypothetical protein